MTMRFGILAILLVFAPGAALACSCWEYEADDVDVVFEGVVIQSYCGLTARGPYLIPNSWIRNNDYPSFSNCSTSGATTVRITKPWKGVDPDHEDRLRIYHPTQGLNCGRAYEPGEQVTILAWKDQDRPERLHTNYCTELSARHVVDELSNDSSD